ncbi:MAG: hypothetical protein HY722_01905 [Planctomycetes bacterium]|nr:hypothetical protein [Planctomycetota bacterium]
MSRDPPGMGPTLEQAVSDLYRKARSEGSTTSTKRLETLARHCVAALASRGLPGAVAEPPLPGFARTKDWDVGWFHRQKIRLAISLKSILANLGGTVPNRIDDLMGEVANLQLYSPEVVVGYLMLFNVEHDEFSRKHGCTWGELLESRLRSLAGRAPPHWTIGTVEALAFVRVDFSHGPRLIAGGEALHAFFDLLADQVRRRNPDLPAS